MIIRRAACGIGMKRRPQIGAGVMAANCFARAGCGRHLGQHLCIAVDHTGKIHHLPKPDDPGPLHRLCHILGADLIAGGLQTGRRWRAAWHLGEDIHRLHQPLVMHQLHPGQAHNIGDLMRVGEHRSGAMRDHRAGKFRWGQHTTFHMHMPVTKAGNHIATPAQHLCLGPDAMAGIRANIGKSPRRNCHIPSQNFACMHIGQLAA